MLQFISACGWHCSSFYFAKRWHFVVRFIVCLMSVVSSVRVAANSHIPAIPINFIHLTYQFQRIICNFCNEDIYILIFCPFSTRTILSFRTLQPSPFWCKKMTIKPYAEQMRNRGLPGDLWCKFWCKSTKKRRVSAFQNRLKPLLVLSSPFRT